MRADYIEKFRFQWTGGLKRLVADLTLDNQALKELVGKKA